MGWFKGLLASVFGPSRSSNLRMAYKNSIPENGVDFEYPIINVPGPPNFNASRNWGVNTPALPFTPEEYKKIILEYDAMDLSPDEKERLFKEDIKRNAKWVPGEDTKPKADSQSEKLNPSSSAIKSLRITPENKIAIRFTNGKTEYTYRGGNTVREAANAVLKLINSPSIGKALNPHDKTSWGSTHYDASHG